MRHWNWYVIWNANPAGKFIMDETEAYGLYTRYAVADGSAIIFSWDHMTRVWVPRAACGHYREIYRVVDDVGG